MVQIDDKISEELEKFSKDSETKKQGKTLEDIQKDYAKAYKENIEWVAGIYNDEYEQQLFILGIMQKPYLLNIQRGGGGASVFNVYVDQKEMSKNVTGEDGEEHHIGGHVFGMFLEEGDGNEWLPGIATGKRELDDKILDEVLEKIEAGKVYKMPFTFMKDGTNLRLWFTAESAEKLENGGDKTFTQEEIRSRVIGNYPKISVQKILDGEFENKKNYILVGNVMLAKKGVNDKGNPYAFYLVNDGSEKNVVELRKNKGGFMLSTSPGQVRKDEGAVVIGVGDVQKDKKGNWNFNGSAVIDVKGDEYKEKEAPKKGGKESFDKEALKEKEAPAADDEVAFS